jgi:hypothetical protein
MRDLFKSNEAEQKSIHPWAYPGVAETAVLIQTTQDPNLPTALRVIDVCLKHYDVTQEEFDARSRLQRIVKVRRAAGFILFHFCGWSFVKVAKFLERDRTNMMHHTRQLEARMSVYKADRDDMYSLMGELEIINTSSTGNDWYYSWAHEQLKQPETYSNILHKDAADALKEIVAFTHKDGRKDKNAKSRLMRNQLVTTENNKLTTVGEFHRIMMKKKAQGEVVDQYVTDVSKAFKRKSKFVEHVINPYEKY